MSGVIDNDGNQWEHCHGCTGEGMPEYSPRGKWVMIQNLKYQQPTAEFPYGRDLCAICAFKAKKAGQEVINPRFVTVKIR